MSVCGPMTRGGEGERAMPVKKDNGVIAIVGKADQIDEFSFALAATGRADDDA